MSNDALIDQNEDAVALRLINRGLALLEHAAAGTAPSLAGTASLGLENLWRAATVTQDLLRLVGDKSEYAEAVIYRCAEPIIRVLDGRVESSRVYLYLGSVSSLLTYEPDEFFEDRVGYACILSSQLAIAHHEAAITRRGEPLLTALVARGQSAADPGHNKLH